MIFHHHSVNVNIFAGALVGINCHKNGKKSKSNWMQIGTDEFGDFAIDLPSNLHSIPNLHKSCRVKVLRVPKNSMCQPAYVRRHKGLRLSSIQNGVRTYNAGRIRFQHSASTPAEACIKKGKKNYINMAWKGSSNGSIGM